MNAGCRPPDVVGRKDLISRKTHFSQSKFERMQNDTSKKINITYKNDEKGYQDKVNMDNTLDFLLPQYGVQDFINERANWQKGVHNLTGEPGWFYFKLFFNFHDTKGLFGGIMDNIIPNTCAMRYLYGIRNFYKYDKIYDRI